MNKNGYWINSATGSFYQIDEHAKWMLREDNAEKIGVPEETRAGFAGLDWHRDRIEVLVPAMLAGMVRVRFYGADVTFEHVVDVAVALRTVAAFLTETDAAGDFTTLTLKGLRDRTLFMIRWGDLRWRAEEDPEALAREAAGTAGTLIFYEESDYEKRVNAVLQR